jgi:hypothetical protein
MKTILLIVVLSLTTPYLYAQDYTGPIIDMHLHDYTEQTYFRAPSQEGVMPPPTYAEYRQRVMAELKKYNVVKAVVSTIGGPNKLDEEGLLIPGYYTNEPPTDLQAFENLIKEGKLKVFGEIGGVYAGYKISDPKFEPYLALCEKYNVPVAIHTGGGPPGVTYRGAPNFRLEFGDPYTIEDVLAKHPNLKVYMMHAGEVYHEKAIRLMVQYPQLYTDLGVILWVHEMTLDYAEAFLRKAKKFGIIDRVMFGSDQMVWPHAIKKSIDQLNSYDFLSAEDKKKIFHDNAVKFLKLK